MTTLPLRYLGKNGVITDVDPFELPPEAFSFGNNIRYENTRIERGGVFRSVGNLAHDPAHLIGLFDSGGNAHSLYTATDGTLRDWTNGVETAMTPAGFTPAVTTAVTTHTVLNNMIYINRPDHIPWFGSKDGGTTLFTLIPNGTPGVTTDWPNTYRCQALRGTPQGILVALNITKGAQVFPTMVKWSDFTSWAAGPANWDITSTTSSAGENILTNMDGALVDGVLLREAMLLYGTKEVWSMNYIAGTDIFSFDRLFDFGVLSQNCVVEHEGLHYVFGDTDIKKTDGIQALSIADGRVRRFIYDGMIKSQSNSFFAAHNPAMNEVMFCYVSSDPFCTFPAITGLGCNRAAIYNYAMDLWYFADLPYVTSADRLQPTAGAAWNTETSISWLAFGGSWAALQGDTKLNLVFSSFGSGNVTRSLRTFDRVQSVSTVYPIDNFANGLAYLERDDVNLDEINADLQGYKLLSSIFPQARLTAGTQPLLWTVGLSDLPSVAPQWGIPQTFDQNTFYKLDYNMAGRYLSYKILAQDFLAFQMSGFDADITILGEF